MHKHNIFLRYFIVLVIALGSVNLAFAKNIRVGAYNIKSFGEKKANDPFIMRQIIRAISRYDIVLIQEIRNKDKQAVYKLVQELENYTRGNYDVIVTDPIGRSTYKEQYAYIYNVEKVTLLSSYIYDDGAEPFQDTFSREPFIAMFQENESGTIFTTVGAHLAPDDVISEMDELDNVYQDVLWRHRTENIIFMGDFNADCHYLDEFEEESLKLKDPKYSWQISRDQDTTTIETNRCSYDRIITTGSISNNVLSARPFNIAEEFYLTTEQANRVSDHYPVEVTIAF